MNKYIYEAVLTPAENGGYDIVVPDLDGCFSYGENYFDAIGMATDAAKTWIASALYDKASIPRHTHHEIKAGQILITTCFEVDESYVIEGEVVSAAEAARMLDVSPARVSQMIKAGQLDACRDWTGTKVSLASIKKWKSSPHPAGRPKKQLALA